MEAGNEALLIVGDFNGHLQGLGYQKQDENGDILADWMTKCDMILMNLQQECEGTYTWQRGEQRSVIDFVVTNRNGYELCQKMSIDEERDIMDISDHNLITITMQMQMEKPNFKCAKTKVGN